MNYTISSLILSNIYQRSPYIVNKHKLHVTKSFVKNIGSTFILSFKPVSLTYSHIKNSLESATKITHYPNKFLTSKVSVSSSAVFKHCTFSSCTDSAIECKLDSIDLVIEHCSFSNCVDSKTEAKGGAIRISSANNVIISKVEAISCNAYIYKSIYVTSKEAKIDHVLIALTPQTLGGSRPIHIDKAKFEEKNINLTRNAIESGAIFATAENGAEGTMRFIETSASRGTSIFFIVIQNVEYKDIIFNNANITTAKSAVFVMHQDAVAERVYMSNIDYSKGSILHSTADGHLTLIDSVIAFCTKAAITPKVTAEDSCVFSHKDPVMFQDNDWYPSCETKRTKAPSNILVMALLSEVNLMLQYISRILLATRIVEFLSKLTFYHFVGLRFLFNFPSLAEG